jgi:hypothetical protein
VERMDGDEEEVDEIIKNEACDSLHTFLAATA